MAMAWRLKSISGGGAASSVLNFSTGAGLGATGVALVQGAKKGAQVGRLGGPWGIAAGAVVGGVVGVWLGND